MAATRNRQDVCFTLDVLTDGSEWTGHGTIFLSAWKKPQHISAAATSAASASNNEWLQEARAIGPPLHQFAISGLGDLTARLAADQRFKLSTTRAVFVPSLFESLDGFSALLLALNSAGSPSLHLVSTSSEIIEELATAVLGQRRTLQISNCQVPLENQSWWRVYDSDCLIVHASRRDSSDPQAVTYLCSMQTLDGTSSTLAVIPPRCKDIHRTCKDLLEDKYLPILSDKDNNNEPMTIDFMLLLNPLDKNRDALRDFKGKIMATLPCNNHERCTAADPGILIRSQKVIQHLSRQVPLNFPTVPITLNSVKSETADTEPVTLLRSCSSLILGFTKPPTLEFVDRRSDLCDIHSLSDEWTSTATSLQYFVESSSLLNKKVPDDDENEIDIEDEEEDDDVTGDVLGGTLAFETSTALPQLIILGTGCATPSAFRGASGYALVFPAKIPCAGDASACDIFLLDCGEGVATMLSRYGPKNWGNSIRGIWISHAHLDHYGGLTAVLRAITRDGGRSKIEDNDSSTSATKRRRTMPVPYCWIMAAPKVLRYIDVCLDCHHGRRRSDGRQIFEPRWHADPTLPPGPWTHFRNIKVSHNCYPAYGLLIGWPKSQSQGPRVHQSQASHDEISWLCFSGDTRPSDSLVKACQAAIPIPTRSFLLLHEATFEDEEQAQAERKKHTTFSEALKIAQEVGATRLLLTHFSQRYVSLQAVSADNKSQTSIPVGLAMDGLNVPLE